VNGVVLATEKKNKSILFEEHSTCKIEQITDNIGMVYSGMGPDYRCRRFVVTVHILQPFLQYS
jgi:20S proteasome alpha/beta subunit